jgi:hypothetical protein
MALSNKFQTKLPAIPTGLPLKALPTNLFSNSWYSVRLKLGLFLVLGLLLLPQAALACGGFLSGDGTNVLPDKLLAALTFDPLPEGGGRERLVVQLNYRVNQGKVQNFGWMMAVPGKPQVAPAPDTLFSQLDKATTYKKNYIETLYDSLSPVSIGAVYKGLRGTGSSHAPGSGVTVVSETRVGAFDISVVSASEQAALSDWANTNGYTTPILNTPAVKDYLAKGWYFVLAKLAATGNNSKSEVSYGQSQPLLLTFDTPEPVYTWRLSAYNIDGKLASNRVLPTRLYILQSGAKVEARESLPELQLRYAGPLDAATSAGLLKDLPGDNARPYYLTSYDGQVSATQMVDQDLFLKKAANQDEYGTGQLPALGWVWAGVTTLFYGQIALLLVIWYYFLGIGVMVAIIGLIMALTARRYFRLIFLPLLAGLNALLGSGLILLNLNVTSWVLTSLVPLWGLAIWVFRKSYSKKDRFAQAS